MSTLGALALVAMQAFAGGCLVGAWIVTRATER